MKQVSKTEIVTSHGVIAVEESSGRGPNVLFLHGNSTCRRVFKKQFVDEAFRSYHLVSFDLPGHGESGDALDPVRTYSRPGLADACLEVLEAMVIKRAVVIGWSLGGHVAIEMMSRSAFIDGLMVIGTPPVGNNIADGFRGRPLGGLAGTGELTSEEVARFAYGVLGPALEPFVPESIKRTDTRFRPMLMGAAMRGEGSNQREVLSTTTVPTAIVNGASDNIINLDYVESVAYGNLWHGACIRIPGASHAPFWQASDRFNPVLEEFLADVCYR